MITDAGFVGAGITRAFPTATEAVDFLRGKYGPV
jgi:hypothetical protein